MAAMTATAFAGKDVGLNVSPTHLAPVISVGDTTRETIMLKNSSGEEMIVRDSVNSSSSESPDIMEMSLDSEQIFLKPGQASKITLNINVPAGAEAGQSRSLLLFDVIPASGRDVSIVGQVAVVLDIKTIHPVDEVHFTFSHIIDSTDTARFTLQGRNAGNFAIRLQGKVDIDGLLGQNLVLHTASENINIGQSGTMDAVWDESPLFGVGKVTITLGSGVGAPVEQSSWFLIFPWKITLMTAFIIVTGIAGVRVSPAVAKVFSQKRRKGS